MTIEGEMRIDGRLLPLTSRAYIALARYYLDQYLSATKQLEPEAENSEEYQIAKYSAWLSHSRV